MINISISNVAIISHFEFIKDGIFYSIQHNIPYIKIPWFIMVNHNLQWKIHGSSWWNFLKKYENYEYLTKLAKKNTNSLYTHFHTHNKHAILNIASNSINCGTHIASNTKRKNSSHKYQSRYKTQIDIPCNFSNQAKETFL